MAEQAGKTSLWRTFHNKFVVEERFMEPAARTALYRTAVVLIGVGALLFIATLVGVLQSNTGPWGPDESIRDWLLSLRSDTLTAVMIFLAVIFGPVALPIIVLVVTVVWGFMAKHAWRPIVLATAMLTGVVTSQIILAIVQRSRPPVELMLFGADYTYSFPSGHVLGACDFLLVTTFLVFSRRKNPRSAVIGFIGAGIGVVLAALSRLYLGYHWLSDAMASVSLSLLILGAVIALDTWRTARIPGERITGELSKADAPAD
ncbi:phosphatase PAP2 family protein [Pseudarthrobacter sp. NIBRBAC000502772]|uniref:phosphatase PAP2 family protein n=1 Tax=Pseudarthrobacter sp. NIBRBAC000502772 TaxID=2590775 RepID=UPI001FEEFF6A|nr:phosphatase PAP2 family protein [Pseudarthrobacter sp. NIBRBAC000502772]